VKVSATQLRQNLYNLLDQVISTGIPLEIERKGKVLKIIPQNKKSKLDNLEPHDVINGSPEDIVHVDWLSDFDQEKVKDNCSIKKLT
jgi:antitoxin (DNA-binding transcriptional repressor) of toxin-antitoxin stability system